jgi:hypothetical protein
MKNRDRVESLASERAMSSTVGAALFATLFGMAIVWLHACSGSSGVCAFGIQRCMRLSARRAVLEQLNADVLAGP